MQRAADGRWQRHSLATLVGAHDTMAEPNDTFGMSKPSTYRVEKEYVSKCRLVAAEAKSVGVAFDGSSVSGDSWAHFVYYVGHFSIAGVPQVNYHPLLINTRKCFTCTALHCLFAFFRASLPRFSASARPCSPRFSARFRAFSRVPAFLRVFHHPLTPARYKIEKCFALKALMAR